MPPEYESKDYWHARFQHETAFEWLVPSAEFVKFLEPLLSNLPPAANILHLGCGTSDLHTILRQRGYRNISNMDYEPLAIQRSREIEKRVFGDVLMNYVVADATNFELKDIKFDLVIDKSTTDAIACGSSSVLSVTKAVRRCLTDNGMWISLSFSPYRYDLEGIPFAVRLISEVPVPKAKPYDPDLFYYCYLLQPLSATRTSGCSRS
ncbi:methyltransferase-like protein 13 [Naviculisporaceae sp. PSN 640]